MVFDERKPNRKLKDNSQVQKIFSEVRHSLEGRIVLFGIVL